MIPVRLVLKDFLSYGSPPPLDFTAFQVACLSGHNGVGKSALLDAITWSVWAAARGCEGGINQDRLIRDGTDEMSVDFTFELGGARYRIVRKRSRGGKAELQFLLRDGDDWKNIAGESLKETDAKIESVLRMDYRTFTASAFFVQGRSEDFLSRMKPDERKDVFARLLDLGTYEKLEDAARDRARDAERERKTFASRIEEMAAALPDIGEIEAQIVELDASMKTVEERSSVAADVLRGHRDVLAGLQAANATLRAERDALAILTNGAREAAAQEAQQRKELAEIDELLGRTDEVESAMKETNELSALEAEQRERQERAAALDARRAELVASIEGERRTITQRVTGLRTRVASHDDEIGQLERAKTDVTALDAFLESTAEVALALEEARTLAESLAADGARLKEQVAQHTSAIDKAERTLQILADGGGECPVCGTALDAKHRARVKKDISAEIKTATASRSTATDDLEVARKEAIRCREEIKRLEQALAEREQLTATREGLLGRLERFDAVVGERATLVEAVDADDRLLTDEAFAPDGRRALAEIEAEIEGLYDPAAHAALRSRIEQLAPYASLAGRLEQAAKGRERLVADIEAAVARAADLDAQAAERRTVIEALEQQVRGLEAAERSVAEGEELLESLRRLAADAASEQARLQERLAATRRAADELEGARKDERAAAEAHRRYRRLVEAFGPAGIPKLIIDNALPELTDDANRILGRLSDHEMSIQFVLERETKAGKPKETFDVLVQHDGGVRDFAMFSGGEAFRVAFAVRLAMSKLLVRRSGARLETLVIDEGFGTQDPEGRERLVEAINIAREEFAKVLVITHLEELKDQFGAQIRVEKGIGGSSVALLGS